MPTVSVISVFHNRAPFVRRTVESLLEQTYADYEIVLVDDGSTDGTFSALRAYESARVRAITHANKGFTQAISDAIATLDCRYIAIQGSGDSARPDRLRLQAAALDQHPKLVAVSCGIQVIEPQTGDVLRERRAPIASPAAQTMLGANPFSHGEAMFRADAYRACGGYRPFFTFAQDRDLFCRLSRRGEFYRVPQPLYIRLGSVAGSVSANPSKRIQQILLSSFAVHCHRQVLNGKPDPLDALGPAAALSMGRPAAASRAIMRAAFSSLRSRQYSDAFAYASFLREYAPGLASRLLLALCRTLARPRSDARKAPPAYQPENSAGSISRLT